MDLSKDINENENQYIWRICNAKDTGILDSSWEQIGDIINKELFGEDIESYRTSSAYRKPYQYARDFYRDVFSNLKGDKYINDLNEKIEELKKERQKVNTTNIEYKRNIRQQSRFELFYENIKDAIPKISPPEFQYFSEEGKSPVQYLLTIADIHAGANFVSENNSYSLDECYSRFGTLLDKVIGFIEEKKLNHLSILELGDTIQGILRINDLKVNETSVVEATVWIARVIANFLNILSTYCEIDYYHCPTSNHSQMRFLNAKASELASEDIEYIIGNYIKDALSSNPRIRVNTNFGKDYVDFSINGFNIIGMHGHQIKNIDKALNDLSQIKRVFYDNVFLAHYHSGYQKTVGEGLICDSEVIVCPSFVGSDPYSDRLLKGSKASCGIYGFSEYGGHTETYKIILN